MGRKSSNVFVFKKDPAGIGLDDTRNKVEQGRLTGPVGTDNGHDLPWIHLQVGAMLESRLAMTAFAHFSLCSPMIRHFDFDTALMFSKDPVSGGIVYEKNGVVRVPEVPGLGATVKKEWLNKFEKIIV